MYELSATVDTIGQFGAQFLAKCKELQIDPLPAILDAAKGACHGGESGESGNLDLSSASLNPQVQTF